MDLEKLFSRVANGNMRAATLSKEFSRPVFDLVPQILKPADLDYCHEFIDAMSEITETITRQDLEKALGMYVPAVDEILEDIM